MSSHPLSSEALLDRASVWALKVLNLRIPAALKAVLAAIRDNGGLTVLLWEVPRGMTNQSTSCMCRLDCGSIVRSIFSSVLEASCNGRLLGRLGAILDTCCARLVRSWAPPGASWGGLEAILPSWAVLRCSWKVLGGLGGPSAIHNLMVPSEVSISLEIG